MYKRFVALVVITLLMVTSVSSVNGQGLRQAPATVRIGLVTYYEYVNSIHFYNNTIVPGFFENEVFQPESTIYTEGEDFWFSPAMKLYLESAQTFTTYEEALAI